MTQSLLSQEKLAGQLREILSSFEKATQSYFMLGRLDQALQLFQTAMQMIDVPEVTQQDRAKFLLHYGKMLTIKTLFENAPIEKTIVVLEQAKQLAIALADEQLLADISDAMGYAHYIYGSNKREGDLHTLQAYFQEALERRRALHDDRGTSESLFHLGLVAQVLDQMEDAQSLYTEALSIARQQNYAIEASYALRHLGFIEQNRKNLSQAYLYFTESLHLREEAGMLSLLPFSYGALTDVCLVQGEIELASSYCQKALELSQKMDIKVALIFSLLSSGHIKQKKQEIGQARKDFEQAYAVAQEIDLKHAIQSASSALQL